MYFVHNRTDTVQDSTTTTTCRNWRKTNSIFYHHTKNSSVFDWYLMWNWIGALVFAIHKFKISLTCIIIIIILWLGSESLETPSHCRHISTIFFIHKFPYNWIIRSLIHRCRWLASTFYMVLKKIILICDRFDNGFNICNWMLLDCFLFKLWWIRFFYSNCVRAWRRCIGRCHRYARMFRYIVDAFNLFDPVWMNGFSTFARFFLCYNFT